MVLVKVMVCFLAQTLINVYYGALKNTLQGPLSHFLSTKYLL